VRLHIVDFPARVLPEVLQHHPQRIGR